MRYWTPPFRTLIFSVIASLAVSLMLWGQADRARSFARLETFSLLGLRSDSELLSEQVDALTSQFAAAQRNIDDTAVGARFNELDQKIERVGEYTLALRQAINPLNPDEVLTIARLTDRVTQLKDDFEQFDKSLLREMDAFQESVLREARATNSATNVILVVLIPLALNFLYTIWKDLRGNK